MGVSDERDGDASAGPVSAGPVARLREPVARISYPTGERDLLPGSSRADFGP